MKLTLESKNQRDGTVRLGSPTAMVELTPMVDEDYWTYRVVLSPTQAILGFPKFSTIGIGFAEEEDWNTNLPYTCPAEQIYEHIEHNKGDDAITREDCLAAIRMIQEAATADRAEKVLHR